MDSREVRWDESCLTLNVSTPALDAGRRPVLVWIHGGAFLTGQGGMPWYNGASFAKRGDIVTVSINYRLGAFGFAHLAEIGGRDYASSGVNGILDQITALEWVRDNIEAFGGDPERVTIAGESAGGMSVGTLLGCPRAAGLFRGAIPQSGAAHHTHSPDAATEIARLLLRELEVEKVEELQALPALRILEAQNRLVDQVAARAKHGEGLLGEMISQPVVDGAVLPQRPIDSIRGGVGSDVAVMIGTNLHETTLWSQGRADEDALGRTAARLFDDPERALSAYRADSPDASAHDLSIALSTDYTFRIPAIRLAEAHVANGGTSHMYLFSWESRAFGGRLRATHALEIPFAFNNLERAGVDLFLGPGELPQPLATPMHDAWIRFVREGDPNGEGLPSWSAYDPERRSVMEFGKRVGELLDPGAAARHCWEGNR